MSGERRLRRNRIVPRWILWPPAAAAAVLLFAGEPGYDASRSFLAFWDLGHIIAFCLWTYLFVTSKRVENASPRRQWAIGLAFCVAAGAGSEWIQSLIGGDASVDDFLRDIVGGWLTLSWLAPSVKSVSRRGRTAARALSLVFLLIAFVPLGIALFDEAAASAGFPVLSDFETPFEKNRWGGGARYSVDSSVARHGKASLRVDMDTSQYSGVSLVYFPGNWTGYRALVFDVFNPSTEPLEITCRIHDRMHERGEQRYSDRFNRIFRLPPGWSEIRIDLGDVAKAPSGRAMDLGNIRGVGLFATELPAPRAMYVDFVRLE